MSKPINGVNPSEWAKHLRPYGKRAFWKRHRKAFEPLTEDISDGFAAQSKGYKRFGVQTNYPSLFGFGKSSSVRWYYTKKSQEEALGNVVRKWPYHAEKVER